MPDGERLLLIYPQPSDGSPVVRSHYFLYSLVCQYLRRGMYILDVGCGSGFGSKMMAIERGCLVKGIDYSKETIDYARANNSHPAIEYEQLEIESQNLILPGPVDCVVMIESIEHFKAPETVLAKAFSVIKDTGIIFISTPAFKEGTGPEGPHVSPMTPSRLLSLLRGVWSEVHFLQLNDGVARLTDRDPSNYFIILRRI